MADEIKFENGSTWAFEGGDASLKSFCGDARQDISDDALCALQALGRSYTGFLSLPDIEKETGLDRATVIAAGEELLAHGCIESWPPF